MTGPDRIDVVTAEIIRNGMTSAALEMARTLRLTAYNPLLFESQDFGLGIVSPEGEMWGEAPGVAAFIGCLGDTIRTGVAGLGLDAFGEGDVFIVNDPYLSGTHISDTTIYRPVFHAGRLVAFSSATAHWADIGGKEPGGWCRDSTSIYQEGICFTHLKLVSGGERNAELFKLIAANVRFPGLVMGDLEAKLAATRQGALRVQALCEKYGADVVAASMAFVIERTDAAVRRKIAEIPDGEYGAAMCLDSDGVVENDPVRLAVNLRVDGDRMTASFEGTSPARTGPVNLNPIVAGSAVRIALKALTMPTDPTNAGHFRALDFDLTPGTALTAERPAPCDSYGYSVVTVVELCVRALAEAVPDWCPAGGSQLTGIVLSRSDPRDGMPFIFSDPVDCGTGGRPGGDGAVLNVMGNGDVPTTPVEIIETRYPVRIERFEYAPYVAGAGRHRGGAGVRRDYRILDNGLNLNVMVENTVDVMGRGAHGGRPGKPARVVVRPGTDREVVVTRHNSAHRLWPGDSFTAVTSGGGGLGDPFDRDPAAVLRDVREELLSAEDAEFLYGVRVRQESGAWRVDEKSTEALRAGGAR
ncbi:hydantoinase B/oxoprolinase family protein [Amycolatopsis thermalba]|uniref:Hydantoinase B/oxoprolinase family protein n=1 Tax=Amycolatopsis thermalba TaxID=944492 RepID=A0ABY4NYT3_9PSEU|nr:hydantoinase B/oxoprolinase family protein [Amycolatopsis thermalba]UQS25156.1 hydantoinase B/oxoprolinase family protein [Amycolatopsis thermalba]